MYLSINLTKHAYEFCAKNYKTLMKEMKDINKCIYCCVWTETQ